MKRIILSLFVIAALFLINITSVSACSCARPAPPKESLEGSSAVFAGKVIDLNIPIGFVRSTADPVKVTFDVSKVWKGPDYKNMVIKTARSDVSCGYAFKQGDEYIVYAYGEGDKLSTGICSRTQLLANAQEDLEVLGTGHLPTNSGSNYTHKTYNFIQILSIVGVLLVLIVITVLIVRKNKK